LEALADFLKKCLLVWIAVGAMKGKYFSIGDFYRWTKVCHLPRGNLDIEIH
jgi:hypothetical protein